VLSSGSVMEGNITHSGNEIWTIRKTTIGKTKNVMERDISNFTLQKGKKRNGH
jgi:hypothetical protein